MAEYSAIAAQTVNPGESVSFTETVVPCNRGLVSHREGSGSFLLSGWLPRIFGCRCRCGNARRSAHYLVTVGANISIPTGGTVGTISLAVALDGVAEGDTVMSVTPAAVEEPFNVSRTATVPVWNGCCQTVTLRNISDQPITVSNANITFSRNDIGQ